MSDKSFFDEASDASQLKARIVAKYFTAWARVIVPWALKRPPRKICYVDLFAGPGRYVSGAASTPLRVLETAIADEALCESLVAIFNDVDADSSRSLEKEIEALTGIDRLRHRPRVYNDEVGARIVEIFESTRLVPTLSFLDPWGYKGLSLDLVGSVIKDWGCDCVFFFNYNRINMGLGNELVKAHIDALFGEAAGARLREHLASLGKEERELTIVEALVQALHARGGKFVLPFRFKNAAGSRSTHHLIFVSKHVRGYKIMKDIMAAESSSDEQGVPTFEYNRATERYPLLFELARPLDDLEEMLLDAFAGRTLTMKSVYEGHHVGHRYIERNYKEALRRLEARGAIIANPPASNRPKKRGEVTFADKTLVTFPPRSS